MRRPLAAGFVAALVLSLLLGDAPCASASGPVAPQSISYHFKVFRVFGDDDAAGEDGAAPRRAQRKAKSKRSRKRGRTAPRATPAPAAAEPETGILELIEPCARIALKTDDQNGAPPAENILTAAPPDSGSRPVDAR
jgi:hypothetical protein